MKADSSKSLEAMVHGRLITMSQWDGGRGFLKTLGNDQKNQGEDKEEASRMKGAWPFVH